MSIIFQTVIQSVTQGKKHNLLPKPRGDRPLGVVTTELLPTYIVHGPQGVGYIGSIYSTTGINFLKCLSSVAV